LRRSPRAPKVSLGGFPVREHSGLIFVHVGPDACAWEVPEIPEATSRAFARPIDDVCRARIHIQEMRENIVDESHFHFIHGQSEPPVQDLRADGPFAEVRGRFRRRVLAWDIDNTFDVYMYGPGVMVVRVEGPVLSLTAVALTTPVDERTSEMRMLYYLRKLARLPSSTRTAPERSTTRQRTIATGRTPPPADPDLTGAGGPGPAEAEVLGNVGQARGWGASEPAIPAGSFPDRQRARSGRPGRVTRSGGCQGCNCHCWQ
jgi:phenylpropionate dioxygenase-like ring-hydroxylating dioxygenase large terminal subunit